MTARPQSQTPKRWYWAGDLCHYVNGTLVEKMTHSIFRSDPSPPVVLYEDYQRDLAATLAALREIVTADTICACSNYSVASRARYANAIASANTILAQHDNDKGGRDELLPLE